MREWLGHLHTEWRLSVRGAYIWVLSIVGAAHAWLVHSVNTWTENFSLYLHQFEFMFLGALTILAVLSGVYGARRDQASGAERWLGSLPYLSMRRWSAKFIVLALPFAVFSLVPVFLFSWARVARFSEASMYPAIFLLSSLIPMLYALTLGWLLGGILRNRFGYFVGFLLFFLHFYGGMLLIVPSLPLPIRLVPNFLLFDYKSMGYFDDLWGFSRELSFWMHRGFYMFITIFLFALFICWTGFKRKEPGFRMHAAAASIGLLGAIIFLSSHLMLKTGQMEAGEVKPMSIAAISAPANKLVNSHLAEEAVPGTLYNLEMSPLSNGRLRIQASISFANTLVSKDAPLRLILNPLFEVEAVKAGEIVVPFKRDGEILAIDFVPYGEQQANITVLYEGNVQDYRNSDDGIMLPVHFADRYNIHLPADYGWYPILADEGIGPKGVNVTYPITAKLFSNFAMVQRSTEGKQQIVHFESVDSAGFSLWGGALKEIALESGGLRTKAIVNELVEDVHGRQIVLFFHHSKLMFYELFTMPNLAESNTLIPLDWIKMNQPQISPARTNSDEPLIPEDWINSGERGIHMSKGGYISVPAYIFGGLYDTQETVDMMMSYWIKSAQLFSTPLSPANDRLFTTALSAYFLKKEHTDAYHLSEEASPLEKVATAEAETEAKKVELNLRNILTFITENENAHVERILRSLYDHLSSAPETDVDIPAFLQNEGK
ncbi:hypothetical protein [Paenibacillus eucommiae]|uniref:ABC transporter permease n=1 Tax=Paenibacillus eucommiae TaxID=1355755 RepID=A0ABS4J917_9BACL|nr:hypothetical protein [Paenibacillus eucommiae]MBP1996339.1 hypothetical protein [Paenibacillus eucommiae]